MKKLTFITCLVLLPLALQAQEDRYDQLTNPKLTSISTRRLPGVHSLLMPPKKMLSSTTGRTEPAACPSTGNGSSTMWKTLPTVPQTS